MRNTNTKHFPLFLGGGSSKIHNKSYGSWISYSSLISNTWKSQRHLHANAFVALFTFLNDLILKYILGLSIYILEFLTLKYWLTSLERMKLLLAHVKEVLTFRITLSLSHSFWTMPPHKQDLIHAKQQNESTSGIYYNHLFSHF